MTQTSDSMRARNRAAYEQAKQLYLAGTINAGTRDTLDELVKQCHASTFTEITTPTLAKKLKVAPRTIQIRVARLKAVGLLRTEEVGNKLRKHIVVFDQGDPGDDLQPENDPDVLLELARQECVAGRMDRAGQLALHAVMLQVGLQVDPSVVDAPGCLPGASFFAPDLNDPKIHKIKQLGSPLNDLKGSLGDLEGATPPYPQAGGDIFQPKPAAFWGREEPTVRNAETMQLLEQIGCYPATMRKLGHMPPAHVRGQIEAAQRCGRAADLAAFVVFALENGGVYGSSRSNRARPARDAPIALNAVEPAGLPTICSTCGKLCPADVDGHCYVCEPQYFGGGT